ncbi:glutamate transport system substrate-binding protein [Streptosporangium becharense]|uniref:Glutamate transport system substrate-binding protein n=1 Tax=Streptosporangium becharense TaxID=1816182 RepID=A0A7W9IJA0_9ACTN|nr:transporter substrate-binding domain-containing protein [Streptosporangium becharense]MBB2911197.1 glutamate transport system substrate-binding protein [Streptosporangium becharense]MBB5821745.1 glutamate transport system substrate-binding protein [Streptosporangium becharense]
MNRTLRQAVLAACLFTTACQPAASPASTAKATPRPASLVSGEVVYVGVTTDHPAWSTHEEGTNVRTGFDIELVDWLSSKLNVRRQYVDVTLRERMAALEEKRVDLVAATLSITDKRRETVDFAGPYMITRQGVMVRDGDDRIRKYDDLVNGGRNVCVADHTTSHEQLKEKDPRKLTLTVETALKDCVRRLLDEQVDAVSTDQLVLYGFARANPGVHVLPDLTFGAEEQYGIGLPDNSGADCRILTGKLREFLAEGDWAEFFARHFPGVVPDRHKPTDLDKCEDDT